MHLTLDQTEILAGSVSSKISGSIFLSSRINDVLLNAPIHAELIGSEVTIVPNPQHYYVDEDLDYVKKSSTETQIFYRKDIILDPPIITKNGRHISFTFEVTFPSRDLPESQRHEWNDMSCGNDNDDDDSDSSALPVSWEIQYSVKVFSDKNQPNLLAQESFCLLKHQPTPHTPISKKILDTSLDIIGKHGKDGMPVVAVSQQPVACCGLWEENRPPENAYCTLEWSQDSAEVGRGTTLQATVPANPTIPKRKYNEKVVPTRSIIQEDGTKEPLQNNHCKNNHHGQAPLYRAWSITAKLSQIVAVQAHGRHVEFTSKSWTFSKPSSLPKSSQESSSAASQSTQSSSDTTVRSSNNNTQPIEILIPTDCWTDRTSRLITIRHELLVYYIVNGDEFNEIVATTQPIPVKIVE